MASHMRCPKCGGTDSKVSDVRRSSPRRKHPFLKDNCVRRRHVCTCGFYYSTLEVSARDLERIEQKLTNLFDIQAALETITGGH
jgi:transcriptional regulator NrdR family protein